MRSTIFLLAAASGVSAGWLKWSNDETQIWTPRETGFVEVDDQLMGFSPKPTQAPGVKPEQDRVLELLKRQQTSVWTNDKTCGWVSGISSYPWTCSGNSSCVTNFRNVVACASGTYSPFFSVCFDYQAYLRGQCNSIGPETGCCQASTASICGTYIWTGSPPRSMFRCFNSQTVISMLDVPQFVIDASKSGSTTRSSGAVSATSDIATDQPGQATSSSTSGSGGGSNDNSSSSSNNTGAIVGGVVGGVGGIALIAGLIAFLVIRNKKKSKDNNPAYNAVPVTDHNQPGGATPAMSYMGAGAPSTYPPQSPYVNNGTPPPHDPRHSSFQPYDPNAPKYDPNAAGYYNQTPHSGQPSPNHMSNLYPPSSTSPPHSPGQPGWQQAQNTGSTYNTSWQQQQPQQAHQTPTAASELDGSVPAGHYSNPVEMANSPQRY